jgi:hypothetical protein
MIPMLSRPEAAFLNWRMRKDLNIGTVTAKEVIVHGIAWRINRQAKLLPYDRVPCNWDNLPVSD